MSVHTLLLVSHSKTGMAADTWSTKMTSYDLLLLKRQKALNGHSKQLVLLASKTQHATCKAVLPVPFHAAWHNLACASELPKKSFVIGQDTDLNPVQAIVAAIRMQRMYAHRACMRWKMVLGNQFPQTVTENAPSSVSLKHLVLS